MSTNYQRIRFAIEEGVATLVLDNPAKRNAFDPAMCVEMAEVVRQVQGDHGIRSLVLTGTGEHFCSGGDLGNIAASGLDNGGWRWRRTSLLPAPARALPCPSSASAWCPTAPRSTPCRVSSARTVCAN